jgi:hypothetical protein
MKNVRAPQFLNNLYRDMRDRRLLLPALALILALIAVPALLKGSPSSPTAPAPAVAGGETAAQPAVQAQQLGVTAYRKRLAQFKSKNPFRIEPTGSPKRGALRKTPGQTSASGQSSSTGAPTGTSGLPTSPSSTPTSSTASAPSSTSPASSPPSKPPAPTLYAFRISVAIGPAGHLTRRSSVKRLVFLPGSGRPLVAFIGVTEDTKRAIFLVTGDVSSVDGEGRCIPRRSSCKFLELKPGDKASLQYAPEGDRTYNLKLLGVHLAPVGKLHGNRQGKQGPQGTLPVLGPDG